MQRIYLLAFLLFLVLLSAITFQSWWPWLATQMKGETGAMIQSLANLIQILIWIVVGIVALFTFLGFKKQSHNQASLIQEQADSPNISRDLKTIYYSSLDTDCEILKLNFVDKNLGQRQTGLNLSKIYQDQRIRLPQEGDSKETLSENKEPQPLMTALGELKSKRLVILGKMGSGKSSFVNYLTHRIIQSHTKTVNDLPAFMSNRPVVRLLLREVGRDLDLNSNSEGMLWRVIKTAVHQQIEKRLEKSAEPPLQENEFELFFTEFKREFINSHGVLLLDGLDEITRQSSMQALHDSLTAFSTDKANEGILLIVTSRPEAYKTDEQKFPGFWQTLLELMNPDQIRAFISQWYEIIENRDISQAEDKADELSEMILENPNFQEMAENPMQLTLLIGLHSGGRSLRDSLPEIYREMIDLLLLRWNENLRDYLDILNDAQQQGMMILKQSPKALQEALQKTAFETYTNLEGTADGDVLEFEETIVLGNLYRELKDKKCDHENLLDFLQNRSAILIAGNKPGKLQFVHKSFHEYLTAKHLFNEGDWEQQITRLLIKNPQWWRKVFLFMAKDEADNRYGKAVSFLQDELLGKYKNSREDVEQQRLLVLAAVSAVEMNLHKNTGKPTHENLHKFITVELKELLQSPQLSLDERAEAGRLLGELGDNRKGVGFIVNKNNKKIPDIAWEIVPDGTLQMGFEKDEEKITWDKYSKPQHLVEVSTFKISRYPITNAQYACFVDAGGYKDKRYWQKPQAALDWFHDKEADLSLLDDNPDLKKNYENWLAQEKTRKQPWFWEQRKWNNPNHPVVGVSWYEALAFCNWLNTTEAFKDQQVRLPTEAEWEYAARGNQSLRYAWGSEADETLGNYHDTGLGRTSTVGLFPAGKAFPEKQAMLYDMTGNVWEWTSSQWGKKSKQPDFTYENWENQENERDNLDEHVLRIIRGGSWNDTSDYVRCAIRFRTLPDGRDGDLGFRVVCS